MKAKDVRTLESVLLEYGMSSGASTPTSAQQTGASAKANKKTSPTTQKTTPKKDLGSPTTSPGLKVEPEQPETPQPVAKKAGELDVDAEFKDDKGEVAGKVVSKLGDRPQPDKVVVQDPKGEYKIVDPKDDVFVDLEESEKVKKLSQKSANKVKAHIKDSRKKIKRLAKLGLKESEQKLFEINFNRKEVVNSSLDAQIRCGWEAETIWENIEGDTDDVDNLTLSEIDDQYGGVDWDSISESYTDWLYEYKVEEYMEDAIDDWVNNRIDDEDVINDFIDDAGISESDWADYREEVLRSEYGERVDDEDIDELSELYGYEDENWAREYVEMEREGDLRDWLGEQAADDDDVRQSAYEDAESNYDYDDWINDQWYSMSSFCDDMGIDYSYGNNLGEVAELVSKFVRENSAFSDDHVESGDYGNTSGSTIQYAVESDSSIDGYGTGAEIISPVFSTPRRMLAEMKKFFEFLQSEGASTNNSTGLHVTMSYDAQGEEANEWLGKNGVNRVKMAVLLGDQYLLNEFLRGSNTYTKSQYKELQNAIGDLKQESGTEGIKKAEAFLDKAISDDKFRAIHFKGQMDRKTMTDLIEFRIGGGEDYETDFDKVFKAVVRYATTMIAGHTDQYEGDYVKALSKLLRKANDVAQGDVEEVDELKGRFEDVASDPILDITKAMISSKKYLDFSRKMLHSMEKLKQARQSLEPKADIKWKKQWMEFIENTNASLDDYDSSLKRALNSIKYSKRGKVKEEDDIIDKVNRARSGRSIKAYFQPSTSQPSKEAGAMRREAVKEFSEALGMVAVDVAKGTARQQPNAKSIGALRTFMKKESISDKELDNNIKLVLDDLQMDANLTIQNRIEMVREGLNKMLQREVISRPDFISAPEVESAVKGMWNVMNNKDFNPTVLKELTTLGIDVRTGKDSKADMKEIIENMKNLFKDASSKRQFNDFYNHLTTEGYNSRPFFVQPGMIYNKEGFNNFIKFVKQFESYSEPVNRNHNPNIYDDDSYEDVALSKYTMLLRRRFDFLEQQFATDQSKTTESLKLMVPLIEKFYETNKSEDGGTEFADIFGIDPEEVKDLPNMSDEDKENFMDMLGETDDQTFLGIRSYKYENIQNVLDDIVQGDVTKRTITNLEDFVTDTVRECLGAYYRNKERYPAYYKFKEIKNLLKSRFKGLSDFMRGIDKIFVDNGFASQDSSIKRKQQLTKDRDNFKKTIRNSSYATINIPGHSFTYMRKSDYDNIMEWIDEYGDQKDDSGAPMMPNRTLLQDVVDGATKVNKGSRPGMFFVVPSAHWGPLEDAVSGSELLQIYQKVGNMSQNWRAVNYGKLFEKFASVYGIDFKTLNNPDKYVSLDGEDRRKISKSFRIEFTGKLDGRAGMGDVEELIPTEELKNKYSGEPLNRSSAASWTIQNDDKLSSAYDWVKYHGKDADKIKNKVNDLVINKGMGFYKAIQTVMEQTPKGIRVIDNKRIIDAGGVEHMQGDASNTIQDAVNWTNLADFFKIERGVDNQGPNILEKVARNFDGNHEWRPEPEPNVVGMERWVASVKAAAEYIKMNYMVSAGNYFRKNPDGSPGDDVGSIYGDSGSAPPPSRRGRADDEADGVGITYLSTDEVTEQDYADMREKYIEFNTMMQDGIGYHILRPEVSDLVGFLKNPRNDEDFKKAVMRKLLIDKEEANSQLPRTFQDALAKGRQYLAQNESVFDRFDKLPLEEQLLIINESTVLEKWSKKYKDSINCSNPKGFSQKAHCAGKKKNEGKRIPRKKGQPAGSKKHSDLYTDENPKGTIKGLKFATVKDAKASVSKIRSSGKKHAHKIQAAVAMEQRAKAAGKKSAAAVYRTFINQMKKKTEKMNERPLTKGEKSDKEKYVKGMKKSKGDFEKRYGKDAKAVMYATATKMAKEGLDESTNDFDRIEIINKILADHFPVGDLKKQMLAFQAIPMPEMLNAFRELTAQGGKDACARGIVRHFVNALPDHMKEKIDLNEWSKQHVAKLLKEYKDIGAEKDNIIKTISGLDATNEEHADLLDRIYKLLNSEDIGKTLDKAFSYPLMDEPFSDKQKEKVIQDITRIISTLDSDYATMSQFIERLEKTGTVVNIGELDKPLNTFANVFGDDISTKAFRALTSYGVGVNQKGPGEYGLACLSNKIKLASGEGDLEIEGIGKVELKAATSSTGGRIGYGGGSQKAKQAVIEKYAERIPTVMGAIGGVGGSLGFTKFINGLNADLPPTDPNNQKLRRQIAEDLFRMDMEEFALPICDVIAKDASAENIENAYLRQNFLWYKDRDDFDALLLISIPNQKTAMIKNENDLIAFRRSGHAMATSISIIPTQAGAGREQWAQLSLKKGTV